MIKILDDTLVKFPNRNDIILRGVLSPGQKKTQAVLFCAGFERPATTEKKFVMLARSLSQIGIPSFRFDYCGLGLSEGNFTDTNIKSMADDIESTLFTLRQETGSEQIAVVAHSLGACAVVRLMAKQFFNKIIFIAPAFNQQSLFRYWFVKDAMARENPGVKITWDNYRAFLDEAKFRHYYENTMIDTKHDTISNAYFLENIEEDFARGLKGAGNMLHIHGENDTDVPLASVNLEFSNSIIVPDGDHDLDKPRLLIYWLDRAVNFINKKIEDDGNDSAGSRAK